jgi:hypothetical protein
MTESLLAVKELFEIRKLQDVIRPMVEPPAHLNTKWLKQNNWVAVPVESGSHFDDEDARLLAHAMESAGIHSCFALATEPLQNFPVCFEVKATKEGLIAFSHECAHFNFILISESQSCAVLCTVYDYFLVSGMPEFVELALGCTIVTSRERFLQFANDSDESHRLAEVARRYEF